MKALNNLRIRDKLLIIALLPLAVALYFAVGEYRLNKHASDEMSTIQQLSTWATKAGSLVHEIQKERGMTAGFLGSKGKKFSSEIPGQRKLVDGRLDELQAAEKGLETSALPQKFVRATNEADRILADLSSMRRKVSSRNVATKEAIAYFTSINTALLTAVGEMAQVSKDVDITWRALAYVAFMQGKERCGIERAVLANTFASDRFGPGMYKKFVSLVTEQDTYFREFLPRATEEEGQYYLSTLKDPAVEQVQHMRDIADKKSTSGNFGIDATKWFKTITAKINLLKDVEDKIASDLIAAAQEKKQQATHTLMLTVVVLSLSVLVTVLLTFFIIRRITVALRNTVEQTSKMTDEFKEFVTMMDAIARNDLTHEVAESQIETHNDDSRDEIGELSRAITGTLQSKAALVNSANTMRRNLHKTVTTLESLITELASAATEIASSAEQISHTSENQASEVTQISTAVEQMTATISESARNAENASAASRQAAETASSGSSIVDETAKGMGSISTVMQDSAESVNKLTASSQKIGDVIDVIDGIADQTNLLALNAAIEAARAGEQGRGFAVVADEVRKLADRTGNATQDIFEMIKAIQEDTGKSSQLMDAGLSEVEHGRELAEKAGVSLQEIATASQQVMDMIQQIATASEEQSAASEEISNRVGQISRLVAETAGGTEMSAQAAEDLSRQAEKLQEIVAQFTV